VKLSISCRAVTACGVASACATGVPNGHAKSGEPFVWDRGPELGMVNRINHVAG
jgi:hypothetical protein